MTNPHDLPFAVEFAGLATAGAGGYGSIAAFEWTDAEGKAVAGTTTWCINPHESDPVAPSAASFMVNSRVEDRRALVAGTATTRRERHRVAVLSMAGTRRVVGLEPCVDRAACHGPATTSVRSLSQRTFSTGVRR